jgi:hypothetical protein
MIMGREARLKAERRKAKRELSMFPPEPAPTFNWGSDEGIPRSLPFGIGMALFTVAVLIAMVQW